MRSAFLIDARGTIRDCATTPFGAGMASVVLMRTGAEVAFHRHSVAWPTFTSALCLLASAPSGRVVLRLLGESTEAEVICMLCGVWEFACHAEPLALAPRSSAPGTRLVRY